MKPIVLNMNAQCRVKLTDSGRAIYHKFYDDLGLGTGEFPRERDEFTLWELMLIFGPHVCDPAVGNPSFEDNQVEVLNPHV